MMHNLIAQLIGTVALTLNVASYQLRSSKKLLLCRAVGDFIYMIHYLLLGAYNGFATIGICALNGLICSFQGSAWADWKWWKWCMSGLLVFVSLLTWSTSFSPFSSACALISVMTTVLAAWSGSGKVIRLSRLLISSPMWLIYCVTVRSIPGVLTEMIGIASVIVSILRYGIRNLDSAVDMPMCEVCQQIEEE